MKNYLEPSVEFFIIPADDIIQTSGPLNKQASGYDEEMEELWR